MCGKEQCEKVCKTFPLIGRILISPIFIMSGLNKIMNFGGTQEYMAAKGMPMTAVLLAGAILLELLGGLSVLTGYKARLGAMALIVFLIPTTLIFHTDFSQQMEMIAFMKNIAIMGGLFVLAKYGSGAFSVGGCCGSNKEGCCEPHDHSKK